MQISTPLLADLGGENNLAGPSPPGSPLRTPAAARAAAPAASSDGALTTYVADRRRFLVIVLFSIFSFSNAMQWIVFAPIYNESMAFFSMTTAQLNSLSWIFMVVYVALVFASCAMVDKLGLKNCIVIGAGLNALGSALKLVATFAAPHYALIFTAQFFNSVAQMFVLSTPPQLAASWFPAEERTLATAAASMANNIGSAVGMMFPPQIVNHDHSGAAAFGTLFGIQAGICVPVFVALWALVPQRPVGAPSPTASPLLAKVPGVGGGSSAFAAAARLSVPPSKSAQAAGSQSCASTFATITALRNVVTKNRSFLFLWMSFSVSIGSVWALNSVLPQVLSPFGISEVWSGWIGFSNIFAGTVMSIAVGIFIDRRRTYKAPLLALTALSVAMMAALYAVTMTLTSNSTVVLPLVFFIYVAAGLAQNAIVPICFELAVELTFPEPEAVTSGMLMGGANALSFVMLNVATVILGDNPDRTDAQKNVLFLLVLNFTGALGLPFLSNELRRLNAERAAHHTPAVVVSS